MSMSAHASTTAALKSLRAFSYDVASVSTEVMMGPLFDALKTSGIQESSIDVLDTVIVPNPVSYTHLTLPTILLV